MRVPNQGYATVMWGLTGPTLGSVVERWPCAILRRCSSAWQRLLGRVKPFLGIYGVGLPLFVGLVVLLCVSLCSSVELQANTSDLLPILTLSSIMLEGMFSVIVLAREVLFCNFIFLP